MAATTSIRIGAAAREMIHRVAREKGMSMGQAVEWLAKHDEEQHFWQQFNMAYARLTEPERREEAHEGTLMDGLEDI